MPLEVIAKIKQKNSGTFKLMDAADVEYGQGSIADAVDELKETAESVGTLNTTVSDHGSRLTEAEGEIYTMQSTLSTHGSDIARLKSDVESAPEINDSSASTTGLYSSSKVDDLITAAKQAVKDELLDGVGSEMDTLKEVATAMQENENALQALQAVAQGHIKFDAAQELQDSQKTQARTNIGAASAADLNTLNGTVEGVSEKANANEAAIDDLTTAVGDTMTDFVSVFETALAGTAG